MLCLQRAKAKKTSFRCSLPSLTEMPDGLPKSTSPNLAPWSPLSKMLIIFTLFGELFPRDVDLTIERCCVKTQLREVFYLLYLFSKKKKKLLKVQLWFMEGILILGWRGKGKSWMVSSRVCVCVTAAGSIETQIRRQVHCDWIIPLTCFYFPSQSRREEMDWEAESSFQSSEEEGGDEQNTNTSR